MRVNGGESGLYLNIVQNCVGQILVLVCNLRMLNWDGFALYVCTESNN